jgi:hypothetical protein
VFFNAMLEGGNNNKPPIWDLFYTTYKHCVIWRMNYYYIYSVLPTCSQSISMDQLKVKLKLFLLFRYKQQLQCHFVLFLEWHSKKKTRSVWSSHGRTTCAWSAMVICTARVSASPMRLFAWFLARCVWCYQSLGPEGTRATRARGRGGKLTYGMDHGDGSKPIIAIFEVINIHWPVF